ncbi:MAG: hypothetical protein ACK5Q5_20930 [Planctomycetaceae bacterium]
MFAAALRTRMYAAALLATSSCSLLADDAAAVATVTAPTDRLLPPNTLVYFSVADCEQLQEQFANTGFGQLVNDPAMADVREEVMKKFNEASAQAEAEIGMPLSDLLAIPTGEAAFAVLQPPGQKIGIMLFLDIGGHLEQLDRLLEKAQNAIEKEDRLTRSTDEFEGTEITVFTNENAGPNDPITSMAWCVKDSMFVFGTGADLIESALVRWGGDHDKVFADDATYKYILNRCDLPGEVAPAMTYFVNPIGLFKAGVAAAGPQAGMSGAMVMGFLPVLGLDRLKGIGGVASMAIEGYDGLSHNLIYVDQPPTGVLQAMVCPPANLTLPDFIPSTTSSLSAINWDVPGAYTAIEQVYDFFTQPGTLAKMMDDAQDAPNGPGLHPKADFLDLLNGQILLTQKFAPGEDGAPPQQHMTFLFGVNDEQKMQATVDKLTSMEGVNVEIREFRGTKIYETENSPAGQNASPAAALSNDFLMFTTHVEDLETLLRSDAGESLAKTESYQLIRKECPDLVSTFSYQRQDEMMESIYEVIKQGLAHEADFNVELLPDFEVIRKYFGVAGSYAVPDENGVFFSSFSFPRK